MAVAAETLTQTPLSEITYTSADAIPELAASRLQGRRQAYDKLATHRDYLMDGKFEYVPIPVDPLSTAQKVDEARRRYGEHSPQAQEAWAALVLDCHRLYTEAARKNTYEYFPRSRQVWDADTADYWSNGQSLTHITEQGLSPVAEPEEVDARINEHVEEITYKTVGALGSVALSQSLGQNVKVRTVSECKEWAIKAYQRKSKSGYGGYVPEIEKLVIRDVSFDINSDRYEEQFALSGLYITHEVINEALRRRGLGAGRTKTEVQSTQMLVNDDLVEFVAFLDEVASQWHGREIYMGELAAPGQVKDYADIRQQAQERQAKLVDDSKELAEFVLRLQQAKTDKWQALGLVERQVKSTLFGLAEKNPSLAAQMFDKKTEAGLWEVAYLRAIGKDSEARALRAEVEAQAPPPGYCGAGSCGLEAIGLGTAEAQAMREMGLDPDGALRDNERVCKCGKKGIVYDLKSNKKGCLECRQTVDI